MHGHKKLSLFVPFPFEITDMLFKLLVLHYYVLFLRKAAYLCSEVCGVNKIDNKYSVEKSYAEGESEIVREPAQGVQYPWVYAEIVYRSQHRPEKGKQRTDYPVDISPFLRVVPQLYVHVLYKYQSRNVLRRRYAKGHYYKQQTFSQPVRFNRQQAFKSRHKIQQTKAEAV